MNSTKEKFVLVTGGAGFIGFHLSQSLLEKGIKVIAIDNLNDYYDVKLKRDRLDILKKFSNFTFIKGDLANKEDINSVFLNFTPSIVINLAAQAGVRYSIENPEAYIKSNIVGFFNILEACRKYKIKHLLFASSSSVYGANSKTPFSVLDKVDKPLSLYAATKISNEAMAYTYSHLYKIPITGLRFFTVYGPYGRPDMAYYLFTKKILKKEPIKVFNNGDMYRDFTFIDDVVKAIENVIYSPPKDDPSGVKYKIYNIGNNKPEKLSDFINILESCLGVNAIKEFLPMQDGDVYFTYADVSDIKKDFNFKPDTSLNDGLNIFAKWYLNYEKEDVIKE